MLVDIVSPHELTLLARLSEFDPADWASRTSPGPDGVLRTDMPPVQDRLPHDVATLLDQLVVPLRRGGLSGQDAVEALHAAHVLGGVLEAAVLHATRELAARTGTEQLKMKDVADPDELSKTARERWRTTTKSLTATEVHVLTGMGKGTSRERVAVALAPELSRLAVDQGLSAGLARMDLVLAWWRRCSRMPHEHSTSIARALFGTDVPADDVAHERLTPEGEVTTGPWAKSEFHKALERLALQHEGHDPVAQERDRQARHARRDAFGIVDDDGTAKIVITGDAVSVTGALGRLQGMAFKARQQGDQRTESQLRSDIARALLNHGVLPLPDLGPEPSLITPHDIEKLIDVLSGMPAHEVQVIVPWDALTGSAALSSPAGVNAAPTLDQAPSPGQPPPPDQRATPGQPASTHTAAPGEALGTVPQPRPSGVGEVLGRFSRYLTPAEVRRIAGRPGTTFYRLLTDTADGRCLERSITAYAPDAAMRAQLRAADVTSRAPGSTAPASSCQLDHVLEYLLRGPTAELNLQTLDVPFHALKTQKFWDAEMDASRDVRWESFWGRIYRTRPHDYRQYFAWAMAGGAATSEDPPASSAEDPSASSSDPGGHDGASSAEVTVDQRYLASLLVYAALAHREPGGRLEADDDDPGSDEAILGLREAIWLRRTTNSGRRVTGPRPGTPTPEELVDTDAQTVLDRADWVEAVAEAVPRRAGTDADDEGADGRGDEDRDVEDPPPPF